MLLTLDWKGQGVKAIPGIDRETERGGKHQAVRAEVCSQQAGPSRKKLKDKHPPLLTCPQIPYFFPLVESVWKQRASIHWCNPHRSATQGTEQDGQDEDWIQGSKRKTPSTSQNTHMHTSMTQALPTSLPLTIP